MEQSRRSDNLNGIFFIWLEWMACSSAILAVLLTPLLLRAIWTPFVAAVLEVILYYAIRRGREMPRPRCLLPFFITTRILFWSAVAMIAVLVSLRNMHPDDIITLGINREIPFIPVLIVAPIGAAVCLWMLKRGSSFPFCVDCKLRFGYPVERGFLGMLYSQEGTTQIRILRNGFLLLTISSWPYYLVKYVNESLNAADRYFFFGIPAALWVIAALYMSLRYLGIYRYYDQDIEGSHQRKGASTRARFLIIHDNKLLIRVPDADAIIDLSRTKADTPAEVTLPYRRDLPLFEAERYLEGILPIRDAQVRFLYSNTEWNADCNLFHYIVRISDETAAKLNEAVDGALWVTLHQYNDLLRAGQIDSMLASEIHRIYMSAMAFKTYDTNGRRLYPIKHYRPTFRLSDVIDYKVDFNDRHWLYVARCNEDEPLYRLRSFWRRHVNGLSY